MWGGAELYRHKSIDLILTDPPYGTTRDFIGIELDKNYFEIAQKRIKEAENERNYSLFSGAV